jgi:hypothetical protein
VEGDNAFPLGKLFLWIDTRFFNSLGFGVALSVAEEPKSFSKRLLAGHFLYVFQFFSAEFNRAHFPLKCHG